MRRNVPKTALAGIVAALLAVSACGSGGDGGPAVAADEQMAATAETDTSTPPFGLVSPEQAADLATDPSITVIDVRTPAEYAEGHLADAVLIDFNGADFDARIAELDSDETYLVYCRSDNRSGQAVAAMAEIGIDRVYDMDGGILAYSAAGLPLVG